MSEMNKENSEKSFEQTWQEAFEGAALSPSSHIWEKIELELSQQAPPRTGGKSGYFLFSAIGLLFLGSVLIQKTNPTSIASKQIIHPKNTLHEAKLYYTLPTRQVSSLITNSPTQPHEAGKIRTNLPTQPHEAGKIHPNLPAQPHEAGKIRTNLPAPPTKRVTHSHFIKAIGKRWVQKIRNPKDSLRADTIPHLPVLAMQTPIKHEPIARNIDFVVYPEPDKQTRVNRFWIGIQRGVTIASPKLDILYDAYLEDYAQVHQLGNGIDVSNFFTEITEKAQYSLANQADIRFGCQFNPKWQFSAGIQYRAEFVEKSTNAFFVNYYDYSRHSFLIDILEGNINNPAFAQAIHNHPSYQPNATNLFRISQFNQQSLIHIASRFEYIGIPMQVGYTLNPFRKVAFTLLGAAQVDKLIRSSTSSYELQDDVALAYRLETATKISTWSWQLGAGAQAEYRYSPSWALTANSLYFENIKPIKETKYALVRPRGLQINVGAKYMF